MENQEKKEKVEKKEVKKEDVKNDNKKVKKEEKAQPKEKVDVSKTTEEPKFKKASQETIKAETKKQESKKENKKDNKKENKEKKGKSKVGYLVGGILLLIITLAIVMAFIVLPSSPEKTIDGLFNCLKTGDIQGVSKYVTNLEEVQDVTNDDIPEEGKQLLFNKLEWKIVNITKEKDVARVEVEITNKDFKTIITNFMKKVVKVAMSGEAISEEKQEQYLVEELKNDSIQTVTEKIEIDLEKQDRKWKAKVTEDIMVSLLPGLEEGMSSIEAMIEE